MRFIIVGLEAGEWGDGTNQVLTEANLFRTDQDIPVTEETDPTVPDHVKNITEQDILDFLKDTTYPDFDNSESGLVPKTSEEISISITSPTEGQEFVEGENIIINAEVISGSDKYFSPEGWKALPKSGAAIDDITEIPNRSYYDLQDLPEKDIKLRSPNTSSTIYFYDNETTEDLYSFIRYNAATNLLEFGSNDGDGEVVSARIDRGKKDWEFRERIQILKKGRGITLIGENGDESDGNVSTQKYEVAVGDGGILYLKDTTPDGLTIGKIRKSVGMSGNTSSRPVNGLKFQMDIGFQYFDTTLGKPIWYNGTDWVDATGSAV